MSRSLKKRPVRRPQSVFEGRKAKQRRCEAANYDLGQSLHDRARIRRPHVYGSQWQRSYKSVRDRGHGGTQVRRVFPNPKFPWPRGQGEEVVVRNRDGLRIYVLRRGGGRGESEKHGRVIHAN